MQVLVSIFGKTLILELNMRESFRLSAVVIRDFDLVDWAVFVEKVFEVILSGVETQIADEEDPGSILLVALLLSFGVPVGLFFVLVCWFWVKISWWAVWLLELGILEVLSLVLDDELAAIEDLAVQFLDGLVVVVKVFVGDEGLSFRLAVGIKDELALRYFTNFLKELFKIV